MTAHCVSFSLLSFSSSLFGRCFVSISIFYAHLYLKIIRPHLSIVVLCACTLCVFMCLFAYTLVSTCAFSQTVCLVPQNSSVQQSCCIDSSCIVFCIPYVSSGGVYAASSMCIYCLQYYQSDWLLYSLYSICLMQRTVRAFELFLPNFVFSTPNCHVYLAQCSVFCRFSQMNSA